MCMCACLCVRKRMSKCPSRVSGSASLACSKHCSGVQPRLQGTHWALLSHSSVACPHPLVIPTLSEPPKGRLKV